MNNIHEFDGKRVVLDLDLEIKGYNLVFSDDDLYKIKYLDGMELLKIFTEEEFRKRIMTLDKELLPATYIFEAFNVFQLYKLSSLKEALHYIDEQKNKYEENTGEIE